MYKYEQKKYFTHLRQQNLTFHRHALILIIKNKLYIRVQRPEKAQVENKFCKCSDFSLIKPTVGACNLKIWQQSSNSKFR